MRVGVPAFPDFESAYLAHLAKTYFEPQFVNAPRGNRSRERLGVAYQIENPRERMIRRVARRYNLVFNFAEVLWYLSGASELAMMAFYGPLMARFSADGQRLQGTAYGPRIFQFGGAGIDQWRSVQRVLSKDPDSKRAYIQIFAPEELLDPDSIDVACTLGLQYFIREGQLHSVGFMRANDAFRGSVSDVFAFTFLQELMARDLGLALGSYTHFVSTYHVYDADEARVKATLTDERTLGDSDAEPFPEMPASDNWPSIRQVIAHERALRLGAARMSRRDLERLDLPAYWRSVVTLFALHAERAHQRIVDQDKLDLLPPCFRRSVEALWRLEACLWSAA